MSKELDDIDEKLTHDDEMRGRQKLQTTNWFKDFNLLATDRPAETNRSIVRAMIVIALLVTAYLISFYI